MDIKELLLSANTTPRNWWRKKILLHT